MFAALKGQANVVKILISNGADLNPKLTTGSPLKAISIKKENLFGLESNRT